VNRQQYNPSGEVEDSGLFLEDEASHERLLPQFYKRLRISRL
jgi:hypothetical protein